MLIEVFTNSKIVKALFEDLTENKDYVVSIKKMTNLKEDISECPPCSIVYIDIQSLSDEDIDTLEYDYAHLKTHWFCIIDPKGKIEHISSLFHNGICDYISKKELSGPISVDRIERITSYRDCSIPDSVLKDTAFSFRINYPPREWHRIKEGAEYTFCMLYVRLENINTIKSNFGYKFADRVILSFFDYLKKQMASSNGQLWLRDTNQGLFLFPYTEENHAFIVAAYRLMLNSVIISGEILQAPENLEYTLIAHLGNITYLPQEIAGRAISDSLNFLFHAANEMVSPGSFYVTDILFHEIPNQIEDLFVSAGSFEGHDLKKLKAIEHIVSK